MLKLTSLSTASTLTSIDTASPTTKPSSNKYSFIYRNLIKKLKTHCIKLYEKRLHSTLSNQNKFTLYNITSKKSRLLFRFFKSDISKHKNKILLETSMKVLLRTFIGNDMLKEMKKYSNHKRLFAQLVNMKWKYFLLFIKYGINECIGLEVKDEYVNRENINVLIDYVYKGNTNYFYRYKKHCNKQYLHFINELEMKDDLEMIDDEENNVKEFNKFIKEFVQF